MPPEPFAVFQSLSENTGDVEVVLTSPFYLAAKFLFIAVSVFFLFHTFYLLRQTGKLTEKLKLYKGALSSVVPSLRKDEFSVAWNGIRARLSLRREADWKLAIIEADKLMDDALLRAGYKGKDMGARLKQMTTEQLSNLNDVWKAHKMRNLLSHETGYHLSLTEAQWAVQTYEDAFKEMQLLE